MIADPTSAALRRSIVEQERAEAAASRAAHVLAEAEERAEETGDAAEVAALRAAWEAAEAVAEEARSRRREAEAGTDLTDAVRVYAEVYAGRRHRG